MKPGVAYAMGVAAPFAGAGVLIAVEEWRRAKKPGRSWGHFVGRTASGGRLYHWHRTPKWARLVPWRFTKRAFLFAVDRSCPVKTASAATEDGWISQGGPDLAPAPKLAPRWAETQGGAS